MRCRRHLERIALPFNLLPSDVRAPVGFGIATLRRDLSDEFLKGRDAVGAAHLDLSFGFLNLHSIAFFQAGLFRNVLRNAYCKTVSPLGQFRFRHSATSCISRVYTPLAADERK